MKPIYLVTCLCGADNQKWVYQDKYTMGDRPVFYDEELAQEYANKLIKKEPMVKYVVSKVILFFENEMTN